MYPCMHFLHAINSDRQTRLLNVFGQIAMFWEIKKKSINAELIFFFLLKP